MICQSIWLYYRQKGDFIVQFHLSIDWIKKNLVSITLIQDVPRQTYENNRALTGNFWPRLYLCVSLSQKIEMANYHNLSQSLSGVSWFLTGFTKLWSVQLKTAYQG